MRKKKIVKAISNNNFDSEDYVSSSEDLNDASSEVAKQLVHDNNHKFSLIMECVAALEAENACLQTRLNEETSGVKKQTS